MKSPDKQQWAIVIASGLVFAGFGVFRYMPLVRQKYAVQSRMEQQALILEQVTSHSAMLPELSLQKKELSQKLDAFTRKIPEGRNFAQLWEQIADVMDECSLTDQVVQPGSEVKSGMISCIPLTIEGRGTTEQIFKFFQSLEKMDRLIRIEEARLENGSDFNAIVQLTAKVNVYYQPLEANNG